MRGHADLTLAVYLEELADQRRVLWIGGSASGAPERIAAGARSVLALDPDPPRDRRGAGRARVSALRGGDLSFRPGSFDLVIVPDVAVLGPEIDRRIAELREAVGDDGALVAGTPAEGADVGYDRLHALLTGVFQRVRMLGQAPLGGFAIVDFESATGEDVLLDGSLTPDPRPARYLAVGAERGLSLEPYVVVQAPAVAPPPDEGASDRAGDRASERIHELEAELLARRAELDATNEHAEELEAEVEARRRQIAELEDRLGEARARARELTDELEAQRASDVPEDFVRLEEALADRGRRVTELEAEVERRAVLVRDLVEELREARAGSGAAIGAEGPGDDIAELIRARDAAAARAAEAEAARAEAEFRVDELRAQLAPGATVDREATDRREAELAGALRGVRSRLAEVDELRETCEARLALAHADLAASREARRRLENEIAELREQISLEIVRAHGAPVASAADGAPASRDVARLEEERDQARAETLRLTALVTATENRLDGMRLGFARRVAELEAEVEHARRSAIAPTSALGELRGEVRGLSLRLADREAALAALRALTAPTSTGVVVAPASGPSAALHDALARAEGRLADAHAELDSMRAEQDRDRKRAVELGEHLSARDALVTRLQLDLAEAERGAGGFEERISRLEQENARLRQALVDASTAVDGRDAIERENAELRQALAASSAASVGRDELATRVASLEAELASIERRAKGAGAERDRAYGVLAEVRDILRSVQGAVGADGRKGPSEITAAGIESPAAGDDDVDRLRAQLEEARGAAVQAAALRDRLETVQRESEDRETLLRSLTAQIEERNDRIRALERRLENGGDHGLREGDAEVLQRELMELQERVARLGEELERERERRRSLEAEVAGAAGDERSRLRQLTSRTDSERAAMQSAVSTYERDLESAKRALAEARLGLEELLGAATANGDPTTAERVGSLLRLLSGS